MESGPACSVVGHRSGVQRGRNLWSCDNQKGYSPEDQQFFSIFPNETAACHDCPTHSSHKCPIPMAQLCLTSHFMCVQSSQLQQWMGPMVLALERIHYIINPRHTCAARVTILGLCVAVTQHLTFHVIISATKRY